MAKAIIIPVASDVGIVLLYPVLMRDPRAVLAVMVLMAAMAFLARLLG